MNLELALAEQSSLKFQAQPITLKDGNTFAIR